MRDDEEEEDEEDASATPHVAARPGARDPLHKRASVHAFLRELELVRLDAGTKMALTPTTAPDTLAHGGSKAGPHATPRHATTLPGGLGFTSAWPLVPASAQPVAASSHATPRHATPRRFPLHLST
jgi:hypothetical protein